MKTLPTLRLEASGNTWTLYVDALAAKELWAKSDDKYLYLASVAGTGTSVKAFCAALHDNAGKADMMKMYCDEIDGTLLRHGDGYEVSKVRLELDLWHAVVIAKCPGFLPAFSQRNLWAELRKPRFTTPMLRTWMPYLSSQLQKCDRLVECQCYGCSAALLSADSDSLDEIVSRGVACGDLSIE